MVFPKDLSLKFSRRRHVPYFKAFDTEFWPHKFLIFLWRTRNWEIIEKNAKYMVCKVDDYRIKLPRIRNPTYRSPAYSQSFFTHFFDWQSEYKPPFSLKEKTVLDVGCGVGETALLFFTLGADKVTCVDINPQACQILWENAEVNDWNVEIINEPFTTKHLSTNWDFCKIDVEGGESCLLLLDELPNKPIVLETHGVQITRELTEKFHLNTFKVMHRERDEISHAMMRNYLEGAN